ncbi:MAG: phage portal protein [Planctomycetes bacterium RBG_16_43_13]|nr:MAG: phage portal protein [Planctomycetes bacterium RBG_16_43_13]
MRIIKTITGLLGYEKKGRKRNYQAASIDRLTADWALSYRSADEELRYSLATMRSRSRDLARNNDYARKYFKMCVANVVGPTGITFQNKSQNSSGKLDKKANDIIEEAFFLWSRKETADVSGRLSHLDQQKLFIETVARDGEVLVRMVKGFKNEFSFALQFLEADYLDENYNEELRDGNYIKMGIEFDKYQRPTAYHILTKHPGDATYCRHGRTYERIHAEDIIHGFVVERPGQSRGVPWMHTAMTRLNMIAGYEEAELVGARLGASKMGFFTSPDGDGFMGDDVDDKGSIITDAEPGTFNQLPRGTDFKEFDPTHPAGNFPFFIKAMLRGVASGLLISYNSLASDLESVNYSSIRSGGIEERDQWKINQSWMIESFCQPVFEGWLRMALLSGAIPLPTDKFTKFNSPHWNVRGWQWVDPLKDVKASVDAINNGLKTRSQVVAEQGFDLEEVFEQLKQEEELAATYGLSFTQEKVNTGGAENATQNKKN